MAVSPKSSLHTLSLWLPTFFLALILGLLWWQSFKTPSAFAQAVRGVQRWPQSPSNHFNLSQTLTKNGYEKLALQEFEIGKKQVSRLKAVFIGNLFQYNLDEAEAIVYQKQKLTQELSKLNELLTAYPYSWQLNLKKSLIAYQLEQDSLAKESFSVAFWLNPNGQEVQVVGGLIN